MSLQRRVSSESRRKYRQARRQHTITNTEPDLQTLNLSPPSITSQANTPSISLQPSPPFNLPQHLVPQQPLPTNFGGAGAGVETYASSSFDGQLAPAIDTTIPAQDENWSPFPFQATVDPPEHEQATLSYGPAAKPALSIQPPTDQIAAEDLKYVRLARSDSALGAGVGMPPSSAGYVIPPFAQPMQHPLPQQQPQPHDFASESYPLSMPAFFFFFFFEFLLQCVSSPICSSH